MAQKNTSTEEVVAKKKNAPKKSAQAGAPQKPSLAERIRGYFKGVGAELKRVVWPSRPEVFNSTIIVIVTLIFFAIFTFIIDWLSTGGVDLLIKLAAG